MSDQFSPGDKVLKRTDKDTSNIGEVLDIPPMQQKVGYLAVYFQRQVWIKPENLIHLDEWKAKREAIHKEPANLRNYWNGKY